MACEPQDSCFLVFCDRVPRSIRTLISNPRHSTTENERALQVHVKGGDALGHYRDVQ